MFFVFVLFFWLTLKENRWPGKNRNRHVFFWLVDLKKGTLPNKNKENRGRNSLGEATANQKSLRNPRQGLRIAFEQPRLGRRRGTFQPNFVSVEKSCQYLFSLIRFPPFHHQIWPHQRLEILWAGERSELVAHPRP